MMPGPLAAEAVIFDLDGTLVDTLPDIVWCLNRVLQEQGYPPLPLETISAYVGGGTGAMLERVAARLGISDDKTLHERYIGCYQQHLVQFSRPFDGVLEMLEGCRQLQLPMAIVTNKAHDMALQVAGQLFPPGTFEIVLGQRRGHPLKPQPDAALEAARYLAIEPCRCLFVGDTVIDLMTARAAGMHAAAVTWGYGRVYALQAQAADLYCEQPAELLHALHGALTSCMAGTLASQR
ncbi:Phosphoglycolate phosphatase [compost metagenome]|jgi:phosphoglycolate phosphatase|uniref:Phosphoglycolate phosphatase n=2 Tax=Pseudomonas TaxID=286 RepID=A0A380T5G0_9PSED|nr:MULTISPECIES: HAD-IA family hydrolase [Pseudomonas]MCE5984078.1 HAD-IA family hydrolase [Pseudomonas sp. LF19]UVM22786.1 HAD-IA family hydrolase [Pseudomonas wadenswilerensis]SPO68605.1 Haloacid dehalogenase superfamily enzyme, subfamily IA [Pseudomonas sp. JV241A]SUQ65205.1 Phosphoglycolate phosphatase [Pseudomonas wadenswilerensis]